MEAAVEQVGQVTIHDPRRGAQILALVWKEWREQSWRLAFGCVVMVGFCAIGLRARILDDLTVVVFSGFIGGLFLPILAAMGALGSDRESGGDAFLGALPVRPWRVLVVKTAVAWLVCLAPILATWWVARAMVGERTMYNLPVAGFFLAEIWIAFHLVVWTLAFGVRQPSEARVGLVGILVVGAWILLMMPYIALGAPFGQGASRTAVVLLGAIEPLSVLRWGVNSDPDPQHLGQATGWAGAVVLCVLWAWALWRFSRTGRKAS